MRLHLISLSFLRKPGFSANTPAQSLSALNSPALPWRRSNVKHTSNELYADVVETLTVTLAPSGRPLAAFANGTIAFTSKVSGVPDITVTLNCPSGKHNLGSILELPVFHPCVRLARWKERPGELSFIPPDGRFILAGYEVNLLPFTDGLPTGNLKLPVHLEVKTGLGPTGSDFDVRLQVNKVLGGGSSSPAQIGRGGGGGLGGAGRGFGAQHAGNPGAPLLEDLVVRLPLPVDVRNLPEIRPSKGDAVFSPADRVLEWVIPTKELSAGATHFALRCTVAGPPAVEEDDDGDAGAGPNLTDYGYEEPYQGSGATPKRGKNKAGAERNGGGTKGAEEAAKRVAQNKLLMPSSAAVSFSVKGWLASGVRVESIALDPRKSRGLGEGVKPYKGVKYVTVSKGGFEVRC